MEWLGRGLSRVLADPAVNVTVGVLAYSGFLAHYVPERFGISPQAVAHRFGRVLEQLAEPLPATKPSHSVRRLRVGLVSGDFGEHPVGYFLESVMSALRQHHGQEVEVILVSTCTRDDARAQRLRALASDVVSIEGILNRDAAYQLRDLDIHILVDLAGLTEGNRLGLFAWRPCPVQVTWLGYFATTGVSAIDYVLADPLCVEPGTEMQFVEKVWYLPTLRLCFTPPEAPIGVGPLPASAHQAVTFGCFNNLLKINDSVIRAWSEVMRRVPGSRLRLKAGQLRQEEAGNTVRAKFAQHGIDGTRILTEPPSDRADYLRRYNDIDICLDPFPYTGGTTTCDALWMGVPVLTLRGDTMIARQGASILHCVGLDDWIAHSVDEYVDKAVQFSSNVAQLAVLRTQLRQRFVDSPVCDARRFAGELVQAFQGMWQAHLTAGAPCATTD